MSSDTPAPGRKRRRLARYVTLITAILAVFAAGLALGDRYARHGDPWGPERLISSAIDSVRANALDALPTDELLRRAVTGMLRELRDPYAAVLQTEGARQYRGTLQGEGQGLGLMLRRLDSRILVMRVLAGSPAQSAGVRAGDRVLSVDGIPAVSAWNGGPSTTEPTAQRDSTRMVVVRPPVGDTLRLTVTRGRWHAPAVSDAALIADSVAYVALSAVSAKSSNELEDAVQGLVERGAKSLVLDLRGNGGGLFEEGIRVASLFLPRGALVASLAGRNGVAPIEHRVKHSHWPELPVTILVDAHTASSAEIIAAALHDHNRALLVGEPTYGKGFVQRVVAITPELSLRLTTARWLTPRGISLERRHTAGTETHGGLTPDIVITDAARRDPMSVPSGMTALGAARLLRIADTAAAHALSEGWATINMAGTGSGPVAVLEARLRSSIDAYVAPTYQASPRRDVLVGEATRLATVRVLEVQGATEEVLRYGARSDQSLRAALEVMAPGALVKRVELPATPRAADRAAHSATDAVRATEQKQQ